MLRHKKNWFKLFSKQASHSGLSNLLCLSSKKFVLAEKIHWMEQVLDWLFRESSDELNTRFKYFFKMLEQNPEWKLNFQETFDSLLNQCQFLDFFTHVGVAVDHGMWGDIGSRIHEKFIPRGAKTDFQEVFVQPFQTLDQAERISLLSSDNVFKLKELVYRKGNYESWLHVRSQYQEALLFLSVHIAHYGVGSGVLGRLDQHKIITSSSFFLLSQALVHSSEDTAALQACIKQCQNDVQSIYKKMESTGVSVDIVNRLETLSSLLSRLEFLLSLDLSKLETVQSFLLEVARSHVYGRSILRTLQRHFYLLSRKVVERNGQSGEHYIARNRAEFTSLFKTAMGGGVIVVAMTMLKIWALQLHLAPLFLAFVIWIIYSAGFLTMQFTGCTLATKIPSVTASRLANLLKTLRRQEAPELGIEFKQILRSQGLALIGNLVAVIPLVWLVSLIFQHLFAGYRLIDEEYAEHVVRSLNPFFSAAVPLGILTGVQLWLSSLAGGWFENWIVFHQIPESISSHFRLRAILGAKKAEKWADLALKQSSGIATNITLGFLFGFVPLLGTILGMNLNGNHVTISTATAVFSLFGIYKTLNWIHWTELGLGIFLIGCMNFGVSFGIALFVASVAQGMKFRRVLKYLKLGLFAK